MCVYWEREHKGFLTTSYYSSGESTGRGRLDQKSRIRYKRCDVNKRDRRLDKKYRCYEGKMKEGKVGWDVKSKKVNAQY